MTQAFGFQESEFELGFGKQLGFGQIKGREKKIIHEGEMMGAKFLMINEKGQNEQKQVSGKGKTENIKFFRVQAREVSTSLDKIMYLCKAGASMHTILCPSQYLHIWSLILQILLQ